jgi:hypothetical protein
MMCEDALLVMIMIMIMWEKCRKEINQFFLDMEGKQELEVMVLLQIFLTVEELLL